MNIYLMINSLCMPLFCYVLTINHYPLSNAMKIPLSNAMKIKENKNKEMNCIN